MMDKSNQIRVFTTEGTENTEKERRPFRGAKDDDASQLFWRNPLGISSNTASYFSVSSVISVVNPRRTS